MHTESHKARGNQLFYRRSLDPGLCGSDLEDGNCDLFRLLIVLRHAFFRFISEDDQSGGNFPAPRVGYPQYTDLVHVRVIPNQDPQFVSGDLQATDFKRQTGGSK